MNKITAVCLAAFLFCSADISAQGILGKIKKEVKDASKDKKEETKAAPPQGSNNETKNETKTETKTEAKATTPAADPDFVPVFEFPESDSRRVTAETHVFPKHEQYAGKIVFSDKKLVLETMNESMFRTTFNVEEPIYGRIFLKTAVRNYAIYYGKPVAGKEEVNEAGNYHLRVYIDNVLQIFVTESGQMRGRSEGWTSWQTYISARGEEAFKNSARLIETINKLPPGTHTVRLELFGHGGHWSDAGKSVKPLATGEFTVNKAAGKVMKEGLTWSLYKEGMVNPQLAKEALEVANKEAAGSNWKETYTKAKIKEKEWFINKNKYGITVSRTINVLLYGKRTDGRCVMQEFGFMQRYGEGSFSKILEYTGHTDVTFLDCEP